jgi:hypothetical protein
MAHVAFGRRIGTWCELEGTEVALYRRKTVFHRAVLERSVDLRQVTKVTGFKRDLVTIDCICFALETQDGGYIEVNEDDPCWPQLVSELETWPGFLQTWHAEVAHPPLLPCVCVLYESVGTGDSDAPKDSK